MTAALLGVLAVWGPHAALMVAAACGAAAYTSLLVYLLGHIDQNAGHRAGAEGYPSGALHVCARAHLPPAPTRQRHV